MLKSAIIEVDDLGPVLFQESERAKRLSITIKPDRSIRVAVPRRTSFKRARYFLLTKLPWAKKHLARLVSMEQNRDHPPLPAINRKRAGAILKVRLNCLARQYGFEYNKVFIKNQKTRWASCSGKNNINLNMNLVRLPQELMDYVILHELVHTRHKNHGKKFWAELEKLCGDVKGLKKQLRKYRLASV